MATIDEEKDWEKESSDDSEMGAAAGTNSESGSDSKGGAGGTTVPPQAAGSPHPATARRQLPTPEWMALDGEIIAMDCAHSPEILFTLKMPKGPMSFHAADFRRVGTSAASEAAVPGLETCSGWNGRRVKIWFRWVQGQDWVGEITKVHFF